MIHLDTHVVLWVWGGLQERLSSGGRHLLDSEVSGISPMVITELALLHEIGRVAEPPATVLDDVRRGLELQVSSSSFSAVARESIALSWTRDLFDRLILANARADGVRLLTRDRLLREHAPEAVWP